MSEIRSAIIPSDRVTYTDAPLIWSELSADEQTYFDYTYSSLEAWEADQQGTALGAGDESHAIIFSFGDPVVTELVISGWTQADSTSKIKIHAYKKHKHNYIYGNGVVLSSNGNKIINGGIHLYIDWLEFYGSSTLVSFATSANNGDINDCLFSNSDKTSGAFNFSSSSTGAINRCIFTECGRAIYCSAESSTFRANNCICYNSTQAYGFLRAVFTNCISIGSTHDFLGGDVNSDYNVSSDTTAPGTNTVQSFDHSTLFPNAATGDFTPSISYVSAFGTTWGAGAIPWERSIVVNTDTGGDYASLAAAEAGEQTIGDNLVLRNEKLVISCTSGGTTNHDTTAVTIDANWNTSESCDFSVVGSTDYSIEPNVTGEVLDIREKYVLLKNLEIKPNTGDACWGIRSYSDFTVVDGCYIDGQESTNIGGFYTDANNCSVVNSIFYNQLRASYGGIRFANPSTAIAYNNTIVNCYYGIRGNNTETVVTNNILINNTTTTAGTFSSISNANASNDGLVPDNSISYTVYDAAVDTLPVVPEDCVIFKDITNNDFRLVSHKISNVEQNAAIGNGTWLYDFDTDITGATREVPWDIGAFKYVVAQGVILTSPADGVTDVAQPITFRWEAASGATAYQLQIATDSNFSTLVHDDSTIVTTSVDVSSLADSTLHYWRVRADV